MGEDFDGMPLAEFCARFIAEMVRLGGSDSADHAAETAPTYWEEDWRRAEGPEECARTDISYWEE